MKDEVTDSNTAADLKLPSDDLFSILADGQRRTVLFHLRQHRAATLDELIDVLIEIGPEESSTIERDSVQTSLLHSHLPKLEDYGLVTYDPNERIVESIALRGAIVEWLDLAVRQQLRYESTVDSDDRDDQTEIRVLLVDDEPGLPETIAAYIERENDDITITTATNPLEAVTTLEDGSFDCIVSDYQMPAVSGLDFLKAVREKDTTTPFILFTAKGSERIASEAIATGVTEYVQKAPGTAQFDELSERIRKTTARS